MSKKKNSGGRDRRPVSRKTALLIALAALWLLVMLVLLVGWLQRKDQGKPWERQLFAMDTVMTLTAYGPNGQAAVDEAARELQRLDALWSVGDPQSEISALNTQGSGAVSPDTATLLGRALELSRETDGLFDATIYPVVELWGFPTDEPHVPDPAAVDALLPLVDSAQVTLAGEQVALGPGQKLDLGGIAKGFASARVMEAFRENGVSAGMVSLGGNIQTLGTKIDGSFWRIGIRDPEGDAGSYLGVVEVADRAVVTSGGYERFFEENGQRYIHILDPRTGYPAQSDLQSATVISEDGVLADALSTALYIMGSDQATAFWSQRTDQFDMILLTQSGELLVTPGVADHFQTQRQVRVLSANG